MTKMLTTPQSAMPTYRTGGWGEAEAVREEESGEVGATRSGVGGRRSGVEGGATLHSTGVGGRRRRSGVEWEWEWEGETAQHCGVGGRSRLTERPAGRARDAQVQQWEWEGGWDQLRRGVVGRRRRQGAGMSLPLILGGAARTQVLVGVCTVTRTQLCCTQPPHAALQRCFTLPPREEGASRANPGAPAAYLCPARLQHCSIHAAMQPAAALTPAPWVAQPPAGRRRRLLLHYHQRRLLLVAAWPWAGRAHRRKRVCNLWRGSGGRREGRAWAAGAAAGRRRRPPSALRLMPRPACSPAPATLR